MDIDKAKAEFLVSVKPGVAIRTHAQAVHESYVSAVRTRNTKAPVYIKLLSEEQRARFAKSFKDATRAAAEFVRENRSEEGLIAAIEGLSREMSHRYPDALFGRRLRIVIAQKALNLYLKYVWCLDPAWPTPVHCPLDGIVLEEAGVSGVWTQLDCIDTYRNWIGKIASCAMHNGFASMAEWELKIWQDRGDRNKSAERRC
ncbi:MAG: hypothetical protein U0638_13060 [Phycisphaerales bacterium]